MDIKKGLQHGKVLEATKENINTDIISQAHNSGKNNLKTEVENILGYATDDKYFQDAYEYSRIKLKWQSDRYNTEYDERYTAIVIAENYEQQAFMGYMNNL